MGLYTPYMITGMLNEHPRTAIAFRDSAERDNFAKFYDQLVTPEPEEQIIKGFQKSTKQ